MSDSNSELVADKLRESDLLARIADRAHALSGSGSEVVDVPYEEILVPLKWPEREEHDFSVRLEEMSKLRAELVALAGGGGSESEFGAKLTRLETGMLELHKDMARHIQRVLGLDDPAQVEAFHNRYSGASGLGESVKGWRGMASKYIEDIRKALNEGAGSGQWKKVIGELLDDHESRREDLLLKIHNLGVMLKRGFARLTGQHEKLDDPEYQYARYGISHLVLNGLAPDVRVPQAPAPEQDDDKDKAKAKSTAMVLVRSPLGMGTP